MTASTSPLPMHLRPYRLGVGVAAFNKEGQVFIAERMDIPGAWQLPQGGITLQEIETSLVDAALRELYEETGMQNVTPLAITKDWVHYDFNEDKGYVPGHSHKYRGQRQKWIAVVYEGKDKDINLECHEEEIEFKQWKWIDLSDITDHIVPFKRHIYEFVIDRFTYIANKTQPDLSKVLKLS